MSPGFCLSAFFKATNSFCVVCLESFAKLCRAKVKLRLYKRDFLLGVCCKLFQVHLALIALVELDRFVGVVDRCFRNILTVKLSQPQLGKLCFVVDRMILADKTFDADDVSIKTTQLATLNRPEVYDGWRTTYGCLFDSLFLFLLLGFLRLDYRGSLLLGRRRLFFLLATTKDKHRGNQNHKKIQKYSFFLQRKSLKNLMQKN